MDFSGYPQRTRKIKSASHMRTRSGPWAAWKLLCSSMGCRREQPAG